VGGKAGEPGAHGHDGHDLYCMLHHINKKKTKNRRVNRTSRKLISSSQVSAFARRAQSTPVSWESEPSDSPASY
jgi:hypothetical protein